MCMKKNNGKIRVNITVDRVLLEKAKTKLDLFGGKLSTLFNAYLNDFVETMDRSPSPNKKQELQKTENLSQRITKLEKEIEKIKSKLK